MKNLLKEAIADAKAVRQTALANAKIAVEEAFAPRLSSMLSAKLAEELDAEDDDNEQDWDDTDVHAGHRDHSEQPEADDYSEDDGYEETADNDHSEPDGDEGAEEVPVKKRPVEQESYGQTEDDDDLDLESIIRELEGSHDDTEGDEVTLAEEDEYEAPEDDSDSDEDDINEILKSLREADDEDAEGEEMPEDDQSEGMKQKEEDLQEAYTVIKFLKDKINEVNLLNAKLLYSNKLFRGFSLNENQKMKVIENFDRAENTREVKLVYATLAEGFKAGSAKRIVKESYASKPIGSTKPKQIITEGDAMASRFKKLAGLSK
jgi:hypothetical protein